MKDSNFVGRPLKNGAKNYEELIFLRILWRDSAVVQRWASGIRKLGVNQYATAWQSSARLAN